MKIFDPMATALSAIENASTVPVTPNQVLIALRTGQGESSHLRALFGDVNFETLIRIGIRHGISNAEIGRAYICTPSAPPPPEISNSINGAPKCLRLRLSYQALRSLQQRLSPPLLM